MIYNKNHRGGGTLPLVATPLSLGGGAHDRDDQHGDARHHRPGVSGGDYRRFCGRDESQHRRRLRDAVAAYRGRADADSVRRKPSRGMGGWIGECDFRCFPNSDTPSYFSIKRRCGVYLWWWCRIKLSTQYQTIRCFGSCGQPVPSADDRCWQQSATQQHAAVAGRGPLEARGISYARKGAAV